MGKTRIVLVLAFALLMLAPTFTEADPAISLGTRIPIDASTFAVPIEITGAVEVIAWSLGLNYNPNDVQINTGCDPSSDIYCSLYFGPFTEGDFFASGAPFNLLVPGVIELDPSTLDQIGVMFGFEGAFGGSPPGPSGDGTLAFVEFTLLGTGESPITVTNPTVTSSAVPEPVTLMLLGSGLALCGIRRLTRRGRRDEF